MDGRPASAMTMVGGHCVLWGSHSAVDPDDVARALPFVLVLSPYSPGQLLPRDPKSTDQQAQPDPTASLPSVLLAAPLRMLAAAVPTGGLSPETAAEAREAARALFFAMRPRDAVEAAAAVRAVAAHFASMDMYARAARSGVSDDTARRLRTSAQACARAADAPQRATRPAQAAAPEPKPSAPPPASPKPAASPPPPRDDGFQPRDRFGKPIPIWESHRMTRAQILAALAYPRNPELEKTALADEAAVRAEQPLETTDAHG